MKKPLYAAGLLTMLILGGALLAQAASHKEATPKSESSASSAKSDAALQEKLQAIEMKVWEAFKAQDFDTFKSLVASDAVMVDINGMSSADQVEPMMKDYTIESYSLSDWKLIKAGKDVAVIAYTANATGKYRGEAAPSGPYYVSSVYANRGGKWVGVYHQETLSAQAMPSPTPAATK